MVQILRGFRSRRPTYHHLSRQTGELEDAGEANVMQDKDDRPNEGAEGGEPKRYVFERPSGSGYVQKIVIDADGVATLAGGHDVTIQPRLGLIFDPATNKLEKRILLMSEPLDTEVATLTAAAPHVDLQHITGTGVQVKTHPVLVLATGSVSGWTTKISTGPC
jgi:hypothetical protein